MSGRIASTPRVLVVVIAIVVGLGVATASDSVTLGLGAAGAVLIVGAWAAMRSARSLFAAYAKDRGMTLISSNRARLPGTTPLLRKGDERYAERLLQGPLADGGEGMLANYTYVEEAADGGSGTAHRFTLGYLTVPESVPLAPELFVRSRAGLRTLEGLEDALSGPRSRVELESEALDRAYEIFASEMQDPNRIRQLFSPSFIVWLAEEAPDGFGFELFGGKLCCYVEGHAGDANALDRVAAATAAVATRIREESLE